mgnify:FL=1|jgi:predicted deacetylase
MKNFIKKNTGLLIRIDDVAECMNWKFMDKCETLFDEMNIKPLVGVIPDNEDQELLKYPNNNNFWSRVRSWKNKGWEISMHGFNHVYDNNTKFKDYFNYGGNSEFFGHKYLDQLNKIKLGKKKFYNEGITIKSFFAPNHTYDKNTFKALCENNIKVVIDGYGLFPYKAHDLIFIPQLFHKEIMLPFGIQSTQIHLNYWDEEYFNNFKKFVQNYRNKIMDYKQILETVSENSFKNATKHLLKFALLNVRKLKNYY